MLDDINDDMYDELMRLQKENEELRKTIDTLSKERFQPLPKHQVTMTKHSTAMPRSNRR